LRASARRKLFLPTSMQARGDRVRVHLLDLSCTGAQVHHAEPPPVGTLVSLDCGSCARLARVIRSSGTRFGVQFVMPLSSFEIESVLNLRALA
jgi:hypothetical protein